MINFLKKLFGIEYRPLPKPISEVPVLPRVAPAAPVAPTPPRRVSKPTKARRTASKQAVSPRRRNKVRYKRSVRVDDYGYPVDDAGNLITDLMLLQALQSQIYEAPVERYEAPVYHAPNHDTHHYEAPSHSHSYDSHSSSSDSGGSSDCGGGGDGGGGGD